MLRTSVLPCALPAAQTQALNQESGRIYSATLVHHYRLFRQAGKVWLSPMRHNRVLDSFCGPSVLHAHSVDAAQQDFYEACTTAKANKPVNPQARYPSKRKFYHTTTWKATGVTVVAGRMRLALARGHAPIMVELPTRLARLPPEAFRQVQLVYHPATKRSCWHITVKDQVVAPPCPHTGVMAIDPGEIHPAACTNGQTTTIICCRELRANAQHRNKKTADLQELIARCKPGSRRWKKLVASRKRLQAQTRHRQRDQLHKVSRAIVEEAEAMAAGTIVIGDVFDVADKTRVGQVAADGTVVKKPRRLSREERQKISNWPHGQLRQYVTYKAAAKGITVELVNEAHTTKTCPQCGWLNKPNGRRYRCANPACGFVGHRDNVGSSNILSRKLHGALARVRPPQDVKYRYPFRRGSVGRPDTRRGRATVQVARASENPKPLSFSD